MKIDCITSITGGKDFLRDDHVTGKARFICYTDDLELKSDIYEIRPAYDRFKDPRRNSRIHKIMPHLYSDADVTIWHDGNIQIMEDPAKIVEKYLGDYDMAMFKHGSRDCIYQEALEVARLKLDDQEVIIEQAKHYEDLEYAQNKGLCSGFFIIRRNNEKTRRFNEAWWADYCRFSRRDQLSLMPCVDRTAIRLRTIPHRWIQGEGHATIGGVMRIYHHKHFEGNWNEKK